MEFELKNYKIYKITEYIKFNTIFFIYNGNSLNLKSWRLMEQNFKTFNLKYYKTYNTLTLKALKFSIYKKIIHLINGLTLFIKPKTTTKLKIKHLLRLNLSLTLLCIKINTKIYSVLQFKNMDSLNYVKTILILLKYLKTTLKMFLIFAQK